MQEHSNQATKQPTFTYTQNPAFSEASWRVPKVGNKNLGFSGSKSKSSLEVDMAERAVDFDVAFGLEKMNCLKTWK